MNRFIHTLSIVLLLMILLSTNTLFAQRTVFSMTEYNKENMLSEELVKDIVVDQKGVPYFATDNGLYTLVHNEFHLIPVPEGKSSFFKAFSTLRDGTVLVIADDAIYKIVGGVEHNKLELFIDCNNDANSPEYPKSVYEDSKNRIWIADHTDIFSYQNGQLTKYKMDEKNKSTSYLRSYQFMELDHGQMMLVSQKGWFYKFDETSQSFLQVNDKSEFIVHSLFLYKSNEFLIGTSKGLMNYKYSSEGRIVNKKVLDPYIIASCIIPFKTDRFLVGTWFQGMVEIHFKPEFGIYPVGGFPSFTVNSMARDRFGCVWSATNSGVIHLEKEFFSTQLLDLTSDFIKDLEKDDKFTYYLNGKDIYKIKSDYSVDPHLILNEINSTQFAVWENLVLVGNDKGEVNCYKNQKLIHHFKLSDLEVTDIEINSKNEAWVISNFELFKLDLIDGRHTSYLQQFGGERVARDVEYVNETDLIISGANNGTYLYTYHFLGDCIRNISVEADFLKEKEFWTRDIEVDGDSIFIGSSIGLIKYYEGEVERIDLGQFTEKEIVSLSKNSAGDLWISGSKGILHKSGTDLTLFTTEDGLPSKTSYVGNMLVDSNGILWVGTSNGLTYADVNQKPRRSPNPLIYGVFEGQHTLLSNKTFELNKKNTIVFDVSSLFYPQSKNLFEYCIITGSKKEKEWQALSSKNQILISDLKVGDYQLHLRTKHAGNYYWSEETIMPIRVNETWYLRWYSLTILTLFILALIYFTYITSKNRARRRMLFLKRMINEKTKDLKKLNEELEAANMAKDKFISIIAHDLRSPFNAIRGFSQMLVDHDEVLDSDEKSELIEMIYKSSDDTFKLLENLLDWANVQKGNMKANIESFNLRILMQNNLEIHQKLAAIKKVKVEGEFPDLFVMADKHMIETVVRNLISNAIKYSYPEDLIKLDIEELENMAVIKIMDHGVGMSSEKLNELFRIDSVSSTTGTSEETGTGFGLMLSKEFVELNNGKIEVDSEKDKGTIFSVFIPLDK
ncbi:ATP-binding protein [Ancylomarina sp. DW003]|nr:ATP-binding protein [Ancylomarina sp. DW003]MDE5424337.1 ATP-binding protein [Ancylomarina sp. DW003]